MKNRRVFVASLLVLLAGGCGTPPPAPPGETMPQQTESALTPDEVKAFLENAQDPRIYEITPLRTPSGARFTGNEHQIQGGRQTEMGFKNTADDRLPIPLVTVPNWTRDEWNVLIDTASAESWASFPAAQAMKIRPLAPPGFVILPVHVADPVNGYLCLLEKLRLNDALVRNVLVFTRGTRLGLGPLARGVADPRPDLVLGMRFLNAFSGVQFDFPNRMVRFSTGVSYAPDPHRRLGSVDYDAGAGVPVIGGTLNGEAWDFCLDTGGSFALAAPGRQGGGVATIRLGEWTVGNVAWDGASPQQLGSLSPARLGVGFLHSYVVTLEPSTRRVHFETPD